MSLSEWRRLEIGRHAQWTLRRGVGAHQHCFERPQKSQMFTRNLRTA